mmetsp:Transcript_21543/g.45099  ORF Transcript_21543/g.45099 Transcript_21543/m.45099 type:complete len:225 (-) Transcript_21543:512-1186(-)
MLRWQWQSRMDAPISTSLSCIFRSISGCHFDDFVELGQYETLSLMSQCCRRGRCFVSAIRSDRLGEGCSSAILFQDVFIFVRHGVSQCLDVPQPYHVLRCIGGRGWNGYIRQTELEPHSSEGREALVRRIEDLDAGRVVNDAQAKLRFARTTATGGCCRRRHAQFHDKYPSALGDYANLEPRRHRRAAATATATIPAGATKTFLTFQQIHPMNRHPSPRRELVR